MPTLIDILQYISQGQIGSHTQELFFGFTLPFLITLIIFFSILQLVGVFRRKTNLIVSLIITILASTTPVFATIATWIGQYSGYTALAAFFIVFVVGIGAWVFRRSREYVTGEKEEHRDIRRLDKQIAKLEKKIREARDGGASKDRIRALEDEWERLYRKRRFLERTTR